ncbi:HepT-like ribonuclease domain-containing protein [Lyngbya confervoides]|uniref:DUF86 domain-containing protein n=1 Tax=Lyngbya confervoides BDU141951 TaxID=1574623 RepID=A0ABD4T2W8_9CYAN|nr:HepT-like ribonuclease domain-containing protein [Lyngbya confervoides]MCM1982879.1 DUF86 domain-containing protein [Lyngbya confervoides BDU141951]
MRDDRERLLDIEEAIAKIERYSVQGRSEFMENELIQTWILFQFQVIGEAARSVSEATRAKYSEVPWQDIIDFRNLLVHEYFRVNLNVVWLIVERELPPLKAQVSEILGKK